MPKVVSVEKHQKNAEWRVVTLDQPRESGFGQFVVFSGALADALVKGEPLPDGTTEEPPKFDGALPSLRLPRKGGGGGGGWSNTKEAAEFRERSIRAHQLYEQERMDRRTALMQAVALVGEDRARAEVIRYAEEFYAYLRESAGTVEAPRNAPGSTESDFQGRSGTGSREGATGAPVTAPAEPEGGGSSAAPPGSHVAGKAGGYALDPESCNHKFASGKWLATKQASGQPVCPRCGEKAVIYRESG
jgi:hypothetical protein